jgi:curli biogenesis system outer membrane secretion channel CsgG
VGKTRKIDVDYWRRLFVVISFMAVSQPGWCDDSVKIVVVPFDCKAMPGDAPNVGKEMSHLLTSRMTDSGSYNAVLVEDSQASAFNNSRPSDLQWALQVGRRENADFVIIGSVQQFRLVLNPTSATMPVASFPGVPYVGALSGVFNSVSSNMARYGKVNALLEVKLINVATGDVVLTASGAGQSKHLTATLWDHRQNISDFSSRTFATTAAGEAAHAAIEPIYAEFDGSKAKLDSLASSFHTRGTIRDIDQPLVCINAGKQDGLEVGHTVFLDRPITSIPDGRQIHVGQGITEPVGAVVLTDVSEHISLGKPSDGTSPQIGDYVRTAVAGAELYSQPGSYRPDANANVRVMVQPNPSSEMDAPVPGASAPAREPWRGFYESGVKYYQRGRYQPAQNMFMAALKFHPPSEVFAEISGYLKNINDRLRPN